MEMSACGLIYLKAYDLIVVVIKKMKSITRKQIITRLCALSEEVANAHGYKISADCFCEDYFISSLSNEAVSIIERVVREHLSNKKGK